MPPTRLPAAWRALALRPCARHWGSEIGLTSEPAQPEGARGAQAGGREGARAGAPV